jgi:signal transduction histidine kinase/ActR/RegA family two-component response regulator
MGSASRLHAPRFSIGSAATVVLFLALYGFLSGVVSLLGWALDVPRLANWAGEGIAIQPNAAAATIGVSAALLLLAFGRHTAAAAIGVVVFALAVLTAFENLSGVDVGIDRWLLFEREWGTAGTTAPGRMGLPASLSWTALGASLLLASGRFGIGRRAAAPWLALLPLAASTLTILGYLYGSSLLYAVPGLTAIALQTATYIFALAVATIASVDSGPMKVFGDGGSAGIAARRLLPFIFAIPVLTGALRLTGERAGFYDTAFGVALHNLVEISLLFALLWWTGLASVRHSGQRRKAEAERSELLTREQEARREAERQATIRDEFLATLSHELRTPLNAILGWTQILKTDRADSSRTEQAVEVIERNARLQASLISDLLDMSRIIAGKMRLQVQPVDLPTVIGAAIDAVQPAADAKRIRLERVLEPLGEAVHGDPERLQQVVWNLLANAVKFTPHGGRVEVLLARAGSHAELQVRDSGEGIAAEFLPQLFERFRQADASTQRPHGGLGLGLALVRQLVELHGGKVAATSEGLGKGATFTVQLPLATGPLRAVEAPVRASVPALEPNATPLPSLHGLTVLVVDDDADSREMVASLLEERGATAVVATGAAQALELALAGNCDVIVSDIGMPGTDGYDLIQHCRARGVTAPAIALTAYARSEDRAKALAAGYERHLAKPIEAAELIAAVSAAAPQRPNRAATVGRGK